MMAATVMAAPAVPRRMVRVRDLRTCYQAADDVIPLLNELQMGVLRAISDAGARGLTDRELEQLPVFAGRAPSTVRKRRSELYQAGLLLVVGVRDKMTVWVCTWPLPAVEAA